MENCFLIFLFFKSLNFLLSIKENAFYLRKGQLILNKTKQNKDYLTFLFLSKIDVIPSVSIKTILECLENVIAVTQFKFFSSSSICNSLRNLWLSLYLFGSVVLIRVQKEAVEVARCRKAKTLNLYLHFVTDLWFGPFRRYYCLSLTKLIYQIS